MLLGQVRVIGSCWVLVPCDIVPGCVSDGDQVCPPSKLTSVNTSKKLPMAYSPVFGSWRTLVRPSDAFDGLSRTITPPGRLPPDKLSESISVSKKRVEP